MKATVGSARERYGLWVGREGVGAEQWRGKIDDVVERRQEGRRKDVSHPDLGTADLWGMR